MFDRHPLSLDRKSRRPQQDALEFPRDPTLVQLLSTEEFEIRTPLREKDLLSGAIDRCQVADRRSESLFLVHS